MTTNAHSWHFFSIGLSHKTSSVVERERFAGIDDAWFRARMANVDAIGEWVMLSTCNRVELYIAGRGEQSLALQAILPLIAERTGHAQHALEDSITVRAGDEAANHLLSVASGLESMVVGESEILGQVSQAYMRAVERGTVGPVLGVLFRTAIRTGKRVRAETPLGCTAASVSSVALDLAATELGGLSQARVTVVGLGAMGRLTLKLLRTHGVRHVTLVNRSVDRARALAEPDWEIRPLEDIPDALAQSDLVVTATGAPSAVISAHAVRSAATRRSEAGIGGPLVIVDMAIPRDVDPQVAAVSGVALFDLDDLQSRVDKAIVRRTSAIPAAQHIIAEELIEFGKRWRELDVRPLVVALRMRAEDIRERELQRTLRFLGEVDAETEQHLQFLTRALVNKLLHEPTVWIKQMAQEERSGEHMATMRELFSLDSNADPI